MGKIWSRLYVRLLVGIVLGILIGWAFPVFGVKLKILGDLFVKLIRMLLAPIIFGTVVVGIARMGDLKSFGRVGVKSLIYFEIVSTLALVIGLVVVNIVRPGAGMNVDASALDTRPIAGYAAVGQNFTVSEFLLNIVPTSAVGAFVDGNMLQVIFFSVLFGVALSRLGESKDRLIEVLDGFVGVMFVAVGIVMRLAPLAALGTMAFVIGKFGLGTLESFARLIASLYLTCLVFIFGVLGAIAWWNGFSLWWFLKYIKEEIAVVFGTCSTEAVLPRMMTKLEAVGCEKSIVGMVLPAGYAFNADGTSIYLTMAAIFIAQATNTRLSLGEQLLVLAVLLLTSKGSAGVAGAGFIALAATLSSMHKIPAGGLVLLLGAESFLNQARAVTNVIGNGVATLVIARSESTRINLKLEEGDFKITE
jgi:DAACS family dicarboxylate/amino acid:cation (Na+ or H+) symporter/aerobic C4-dicarboxylate transport protein